MADDNGTLAPGRLLEALPDAAVFADREGVIRTWNQAATRIFGFTAEEAIGQTLDLIVPEAFREQHWTGYDRALTAGETKYVGQALPTRSLTASGAEIYVELAFAIVKDETGHVLGALATARDISERFQRDRDLRRELRQLRDQVQGQGGQR